VTTVRRSFALAAIGAVALVALSGCRLETGSAAYVGSTRYTNDQVTRVANKVSNAKQLDISGPSGVAALYVLRDVSGRLIKEKGWTTSSPVHASDVSGAFDVPADSEYASLRAEVETNLNAIKEHVTPTKPTSDDLHDLYDRARLGGLITDPTQQTFENVSPQFDSPDLETALAQRAALLDAIKRYDVSVNPKYAPAEYPLLSFQGGVPAVVVALNARSINPGVVDLPQTGAPSQPAQ
jgi:hypothetical protein